MTDDDFTLTALLNKWAELDPNHYSGFDFWADRYEQLAKLQRTVQEALQANRLLYRLENTKEGIHHTTVLSLDNGRHAIGDDPDPALALLKAYVNWLEKAR